MPERVLVVRTMAARVGRLRSGSEQRVPLPLLLRPWGETRGAPRIAVGRGDVALRLPLGRGDVVGDVGYSEAVEEVDGHHGDPLEREAPHPHPRDEPRKTAHLVRGGEG